MTYRHKIHFANGDYPLCGHPCWGGARLSMLVEDVTCKKCLHILDRDAK